MLTVTINDIISLPIWSYASFFLLLLIYVRSIRKPFGIYVGGEQPFQIEERSFTPKIKQGPLFPKPIPGTKIPPKPDPEQLDRILELATHNGYNIIKIKKALERRWEYLVDEEFDLDEDLLQLLRIKTGKQNPHLEYTEVKE